MRAPPYRAPARAGGPRPRAGAAWRPSAVVFGALGVMAAAAAFAAGAGVSGCTSTLRALDCGPLPDRNGCPTRGGGTCADRTCSALYTCTDAGWQLDEPCPGNNQGPAGGAGGGAGAGGAGGSPGACVAPSAPPDVVPCSPLQAPECDESIALTCPDRACLTGCAVFLRCENGEWLDELAAYCDDETGELIVNTKL